MTDELFLADAGGLQLSFEDQGALGELADLLGDPGGVRLVIVGGTSQTCFQLGDADRELLHVGVPYLSVPVGEIRIRREVVRPLAAERVFELLDPRLQRLGFLLGLRELRTCRLQIGEPRLQLDLDPASVRTPGHDCYPVLFV